GYKQIPNDISATRFPKHDANDKLCALIKVISDIDQLGFESNLGIVGNIEKKTGEYWIYVSPGERKLSMWGPNLLKYNLNLSTLPKSGKVYQVVVTRKGEGIKSGFNTGFILLKTQPPGAKIWIDDEYRGITPFQQEMTGGYYNYRVEKEMFYSKEGGFTVLVNETVTEDIVLDPNFGSLTVKTTPIPGAQISLDGVPTDYQTPHTFDTLASGVHTTSLIIDLYEPINREVTINDNEKANFEIGLNPVFGNVEISASPNAEIYIDKVIKGNGTYSGILTIGMHTIEARLDKYYPQTEKLDMEAGAIETVSFQLEPITGSLSIITDPPEAEIILNGEPYGKSPKIINDLIIGTYNLEFKKDKYATVKKQVEIKENERKKVEENLSNFKEITISSKPSSAKLVLNGKNEGTTPKTITTSFGENRIKLTAQGYNDLETTFNVTEQKDKYSFTLTSDKKAMAQLDFNKYKRRKNLWLGGTIVSAGIGAYYLYSADNHYKEYETATENATDLHNQIKTEDTIWPIAFGVSGFCAVMTIINGTKQGKAKKQIGISVVPLEGGGMLSFKFPIGD
ncbi:MAG: PEGA domain-containing protein, partial [Bacteroidales bacterium]|nr:PEGA domain-containing protein [Bacteroidales bacterium]